MSAALHTFALCLDSVQRQPPARERQAITLKHAAPVNHATAPNQPHRP